MPGELTAVADPTQLVPGDPDELEDLARTLGRFAHGMGDGADRLGRIKAGSWKGHGGNAFRGILDKQPAKFGTASDAFGQAQLAISRYAGELRDAQRSAVLAVGQYGAAERATAGWNRKGSDPGEADRDGAHRMLNGARDRVEVAALRAARTLDAAAHGAPKKPGIWHRLAGGIESLVGRRAGHELIDIGKGMADGIKDMATGLWTLTGAVLTNPSKFARAWSSLGMTMATTQGRQEFARSFVDWDEWSKDPGRAFGNSAVNIASIFAGGEGLAGKLGDAAKFADAGELSVEMQAVLKATEANPATLDGFPAWKGLSGRARWAQRYYTPKFSNEIESPVRNQPVKDVVRSLKSGKLKPTDLRIDTIRRGKNLLILNTRSTNALIRAGIPRSEWIVRNVTGDKFYENRLSRQLRRNRLTPSGIDHVYESGGADSPPSRPDTLQSFANSE
jgi:hypothetical protein